MMVCDRCKKELICNERESAETTITIYKARGAYACRVVDLCPNCKRLFSDFKGMMESFFMVNDDPESIFKDKVYWKDGHG